MDTLFGILTLMRVIFRAPILAVAFLTASRTQAQDVVPIEKTLSPTGVCIARDGSDDDYKFWDARSKKIVGTVIPTEMEGISNVAFVSDWNQKGNKLALLLFYGTKLNTILLYVRSRDGDFKEIKFVVPDPVVLYNATYNRKFDLAESSGNDYNSLGPWLDENTVNLISGTSKDVYNSGNSYLGTSTLLVTFKAHFQNSSVTISNQQLIGPLPDKARDKFFTKWGEKYSEAD